MSSSYGPHNDVGSHGLLSTYNVAILLIVHEIVVTLSKFHLFLWWAQNDIKRGSDLPSERQKVGCKARSVVYGCSVSCHHERDTSIPVALISAHNLADHRVQCHVVTFQHAVARRTMRTRPYFVNYHGSGHLKEEFATELRFLVAEQLVRHTQRLKICSTKTLATVAALWPRSEYASAPLVKWSMTASIYWRLRMLSCDIYRHTLQGLTRQHWP